MAEERTTVDIQNQALDVLEELVGQWRIEISNAEFLDEGAKLVGRMSVTWLDGQAFLLLRCEGSTAGRRPQPKWSDVTKAVMTSPCCTPTSAASHASTP